MLEKDFITLSADLSLTMAGSNERARLIPTRFASLPRRAGMPLV